MSNDREYVFITPAGAVRSITATDESGSKSLGEVVGDLVAFIALAADNGEKSVCVKVPPEHAWNASDALSAAGYDVRVPSRGELDISWA